MCHPSCPRGLAWCFLVVQLVVYVFRAVPTKVIKCERVDYGCGAEPHGYAVPFCWMRVWHADAMKTLASLNRMVFLLDGQTEYAIKRAYFKLVSDPGERPYTFFHVLKMDMRIMLFDAFFINFLQNCAKLQFQTSYIAFLMYANLAANDARCYRMVPGCFWLIYVLWICMFCILDYLGWNSASLAWDTDTNMSFQSLPI